jgi:phosphatidate cytidylyltransferase
MAFGRTKLLERISPKKTWEGFIGGGLATIPFSVLIKNLVSLDFSITDWMIIAVLVVVAGNAGDLAESVLKRSLNVKDSGKVFPGHGGFLDRFDSILLALPAVFAYLYIFKL